MAAYLEPTETKSNLVTDIQEPIIEEPEPEIRTDTTFQRQQLSNVHKMRIIDKIIITCRYDVN
jgi:hypothetical protein